MKIFKKLLLVATFAFMPVAMSFAQSTASNYIHNWVKANNTLKSGAITDTQGYVILYGYNGATWSGIPRDLSDALKAEANAGRRIDDVCLTEDGGWYIVGHKVYGKGYPEEFGNRIQEALRIGDQVLSVSFNDYGDWIIVTNNHYYTSDSDISTFMRQYQNRYGGVKSASVSNNGGIVVVYNNGYATRGTIPQKLLNYLEFNRTFNMTYVKFTDDGSYLVTDGSGGNYSYDLR